MDKTFNIDRYIELMEKQKTLQSVNDNLNKINYNELLSYQIIIYNQFIYNKKNEYISLINQYINNEIDSFVLQFKFFQIRRIHIQNAENLEENFQELSNMLIDEKSDDFSKLIEHVSGICDYLKCNSDDETEYGITEKDFRILIEKIHLKLQQFEE